MPVQSDSRAATDADVPGGVVVVPAGPVVPVEHETRTSASTTAERNRVLPLTVDAPFIIRAAVALYMIAASIKEMGLGESKLGFELGDDQRLGIPVNYLSGLTEALPKAQIKDGSAALNEMRVIKSPREIEFMRKACEISVKAYDRCLPQMVMAAW